MEENFDKFSSTQQHTTGSTETLEKSFTVEKETEQTTPTKLLTRTLLNDEQESTNKNSPQKKVVADTSLQYLSDASNISPSQRMDDEKILKVTDTSCEIKETVGKPEESLNFSITKAFKTEEFGENTLSRENPIDDTRDQTLNYDLADTDQTSCETPIKDVLDMICKISQTSEHFLASNESPKNVNMILKSDCLIDNDSTNQNTVYTDKLETQVNQTVLSDLLIEISQNRENSSEADNSQDKLYYSETTQNLPKTIQGNLKNKGEFEILNIPNKRLESENDSLALSEGKEMLKAKCDSYIPSRHDCKRDSGSNQTRPNFDCKLSHKIKPSSKKEFKGSEKTTNINKVVTKISQAEINPESTDTINKSIETHQITESSELSERTSSDSPENTEMGDNSGITYSKLTLGVPSTPVVSPELPYCNEISREADVSTSRELKSSESEESQTKGGVYTPSSKYTENVEISENSCGLNKSMKSQNNAEEHHSVKNLTTAESPEPETSYTGFPGQDEQKKSDENSKSGENNVPVQNTSSTEISSKPPELQVKSDEVSRDSVSAVRSSGSATFNLDMGALIPGVINGIAIASLTFRSLFNYWRNRNPVLEINAPENTQTHRHILVRLNCIHVNMIRIANAANSSVQNILERIRSLRPHFDGYGVVLHSLNAMDYYSRDLRDVARIVHYLRSLCLQNTPYRYYYQALARSVVAIHRALIRITEQLRRLEIIYRNDNARTKKPDT